MKHPATAMVFGVIASDGEKKMTVFFPSGLKITADIYLDVLKKKVLRWVTSNFKHKDCVPAGQGSCLYWKKSSKICLGSSQRKNGL